MVDRKQAFKEWKDGIISDKNLKQVVKDLTVAYEVFAAKRGTAALRDAWRNLDKAEQTALKTRLDHHKKTAEIIDAKDGVPAE